MAPPAPALSKPEIYNNLVTITWIPRVPTAMITGCTVIIGLMSSGNYLKNIKKFTILCGDLIYATILGSQVEMITVVSSVNSLNFTLIYGTQYIASVYCYNEYGTSEVVANLFATQGRNQNSMLMFKIIHILLLKSAREHAVVMELVPTQAYVLVLMSTLAMTVMFAVSTIIVILLVHVLISPSTSPQFPLLNFSCRL